MIAFQNLDQAAGRFIHQDGKRLFYFGGTAYLGLLNNPDFIKLFRQGVDIFGLNNGTSRSNNVQLGVYNKAEKVLARRFGFESACLLSSGYLAAQVAVRSLSEDKEVIYAPNAHPSLWLDNLTYDGRTFEQWRTETIAYINSSTTKDFVIISNTMDNLFPNTYDFKSFAALCDPKKRLLFVLDDSHGIGVYKENSVTVEIKELEGGPTIELFIIASLAKGMGTDAGLLLGKQAQIEAIKHSLMFLGASPPSPAAIYALLNGADIYKSSFEKLHTNIDLFCSLIKEVKSLSYTACFPVFTSKQVDLYAELLKMKVVISSFSYPFPDSKPLNRIVLSALHEKEDLYYLAESYLSINQ